jgi:hypothetical protein
VDIRSFHDKVSNFFRSFCHVKSAKLDLADLTAFKTRLLFLAPGSLKFGGLLSENVDEQKLKETPVFMQFNINFG